MILNLVTQQFNVRINHSKSGISHERGLPTVPAAGVGFGGYAGHPGDTGWPRPPGARMLWAGRFPVWCAGCWPDGEVRVMRGSPQVAVIGSCASADLSFAARDVHGLAVARAGSCTVIQA